MTLPSHEVFLVHKKLCFLASRKILFFVDGKKLNQKEAYWLRKYYETGKGRE